MFPYKSKSIRFAALLMLSTLTYADEAENVLVNGETFAQQWSGFKTALIRKEKSFQSYEEFKSNGRDVKAITYPSGNFQLKALLNTTNITPQQKSPVIVYLHGGFALSHREFEQTKIFVENGFIVFAPTYRGENGNSGYFELFMGEVEDAKAAIDWISKQTYIDANQIYTFGWSVGGGIALNLSMHSDVNVRLGGSSAGIYDKDLIKAWATEDDMIKFPYDWTNERENYFRLPIYNLGHMAREHYVYIGQDDDFEFVSDLKNKLYGNKTTKLNLKAVDGDHVSSLKEAMNEFILQIKLLPDSV